MVKISPKNIAEAVYLATEGKSGAHLEEVLKRSVKILADRRMLGKGDEMLQALQKIIDKKEGIVRLKITTAGNMSASERKKLEEEIKEQYKAEKVISEYFEKEELLGGMRVEVEDELLDTTYRNRLENLEKFLIQAR
ncbi:hypothetical protein A2914_01765 [Candidatus Nomurabacteria bacterium RIFCSPLOWO2_01_FULL_41_21]|uniref:ATP synthase subunit delta n=2 Tax=Candidatus Nomuraibacteriota TaxID=1752729 RepID=A0A1F6X1P8_9BACT|nr:MAG: hypothetical protein A2647_05255 [Candidatus Nomurabacteria bacterium RIFCSPHIGHO2_01_FULL_40_24b]OGI88044.1 MAG: hypothetical protein A2914_01765 [Candidatus Nomurabacteria bacterium RIFCSPLOWO2_01_FULL_41_21]